MIFFLLANSIIGFVRFQWQKWLRKLELREHLAAAFHGKHLNLSFSRGFCYFSDFFIFGIELMLFLCFPIFART